jgi:hypothetical protein
VGPAQGIIAKMIQRVNCGKISDSETHKPLKLLANDKGHGFEPNHIVGKNIYTQRLEKRRRAKKPVKYS